MPSFSRLATLSTLAFAALTTAAPVQERQLDVLNGLLGGDAAGGALASLPNILTGLLADLGPVNALLGSVTSANATADIISPLTSQISTLASGAVSQVSALAGQPLDTIVGTAEGALDATGVANLLAPVLTQTYGALNGVLAIADEAGVTDIVQPLLDEATSALNPLLETAAPLVNGLLAAAAPLLAPITGLADQLGLGPVLSLVDSIL